MTDEELRQLFGAIRQENAAAHEETRHIFKITADGLRVEIQLVAEAVLHLDEKLDRTADDIRSEMRRGFAETQAMIKFSHAELDRRVNALEEGMSDLRERVERLESNKLH